MKEEKIKFAKVEYKECNLVKVTDLPFDDIIGHTDNKQEYFTLENNNIIYKRLREELNMQYSLPRLGVSVDFGLGDICLEECTLEDKKIFKFYTIDRNVKFDYAEFDNVKDAVKRLVEYYKKNKFIYYSETAEECNLAVEMMLTIFFETLNLNNVDEKRHVLEKKKNIN